MRFFVEICFFRVKSQTELKCKLLMNEITKNEIKEKFQLTFFLRYFPHCVCWRRPLCPGCRDICRGRRRKYEVRLSVWNGTEEM